MAGSFCPYCFEPKNGTPTCPCCGHTEGEPVSGVYYLPVGSVVGRKLRIGMVLGQGGFGITYLAYDMETRQKVAVKEYFPRGYADRNGFRVVPSSPESVDLYSKGVESFYREAKTLSEFQFQPNIVSIRGFFRENNTAYSVMEYIDGISLEEYLKRRNSRISFNETLAILDPVMDALETLHRKDVLHRDISPDNIMIRKDGAVKLLDFGAARNDFSIHTHTTAAVLKPGYAPAEQYSVAGKQDVRTDIYALGAVMYRCLTGKTPPDAMERMVGKPLPPIEGISEKRRSAVEKALALQVTDRWENIGEFRRALDYSKEKLPEIHIPPLKRENSSDKNRKRHPAVFFLIAVLILLSAYIMIHFVRPSALELSESETDPKLRVVIGDVVQFGHYEQDPALPGDEPIEWIVLDTEDDRALLVSRYALEFLSYQNERVSVDWESSDLLKWLNTEFYDKAFNTAERAYISSDEENNVFLLSLEEAERYFTSDEARVCRGTKAMLSEGGETGNEGGVYWWLRSGGIGDDCAAIVYDDGTIHPEGVMVDYPGAVRPAVRITLSPEDQGE